MNEEIMNKTELDPDDVAKDVVFGEPEAVQEAPAAAEAVAPQAEPEAAAEAAAQEAPAAEAAAVDCSLDEFKSILDEQVQALKTMIKYTKTKDETIYKLSNELQKHREDYCAKSFKSIASLIISFREDCRKSLEELGQFELTVDKAKKYMLFLGDDFQEMLSNIGCEEEDDKWLFNGKPLSVTEEKAAVCFPAVFQDFAVPADIELPSTDAQGIKGYLDGMYEQVKVLLSNNEMLDKCLKEYCVLSSSIEDDLVLLNVYPSVRLLLSVYRKLMALVEQNTQDLTEENKNDRYGECLRFLIDKLEEVLLSGGVKIDTTCDDLFDTKKNRLIRTVVTEDAALDRHIAKRHTECYTANDVVIYPAKVDVYKYQAPKA